MDKGSSINQLKKYIFTKFQEAGYQKIDKDMTIYNFDNFTVKYVGTDNQYFTINKEYIVIGLRILKGIQQDMYKLILFDDNRNVIAEYSFFFDLIEDYDISKLELCHTCKCMKYFKIINNHQCGKCLESESKK